MAFQFGRFMAVALVGGLLAGCEATPTTGGGMVSDGLNRNVLIQNRSGTTIYRFYGSNVGTNSWEEDILGANVLPNGQSIMIDFDDGTGYCDFDFKIEFIDGSTVEDYGIDVCAIGTYTVYP
ncbi:hypothetical protein [Wenxinia saemankumensis]|uniref:Secreted protein n=1 Tax=Wenxinia saemankumensis TaxID=1447782 RepID=A0A1M6C2N9_9RHOB|nr:hypothetical protein [Wenxinia saemankumensis]SHI55279.1 hypothetical protein SAMN05444417_0974 [Wenxinia saemankumensis]